MGRLLSVDGGFLSTCGPRRRSGGGGAERCLGRTPHIFRVGFPRLRQAGDTLIQEGADLFFLGFSSK